MKRTPRHTLRPERSPALPGAYAAREQHSSSETAQRLRLHLAGLSAFRPCGRDLVELSNSTVWAFYVQVAAPVRLPDAGRLIPTCRFRANFALAYQTPTISDRFSGGPPFSTANGKFMRRYAFIN